MGAEQALDWAMLIPGWATLLVPGVLPVLGRSASAAYVLSAIAAIVPLIWWIVAFASGFYAPVIALLTTTAWAFGVSVACLQRMGMKRGWLWARFPLPALTVLTVLGGLTIVLNGIHVE